MKKFVLGFVCAFCLIGIYKVAVYAVTIHVSTAQKTYLSVMPATHNGGIVDNWCVVDPREYAGFGEIPKSYVQVDGMRGDTAVVTVLNPGDSGCKAGSAVYTPISLLRKAIYRQKTSK
jgi:hypothetical protein